MERLAVCALIKRIFKTDLQKEKISCAKDFTWKPLLLNAAQKFKIAFFEIFHPQKHFIMTHPNIGIFEKVLSNPLNYHLLILWNWGVGSKNFFLFFLYTILLYMKKFSNTVNHSNKLMLTYFFCAVFIDLYFKTKHSNETFHLGLYSLSNVFSHRKHISSKSNISVLTISGKQKYKNHSPLPPHFIINPPILWYALNIPWESFYYDSLILRHFSGIPTPAYSTLPPCN